MPPDWQQSCSIVNMRNLSKTRNLCSELVSILCGCGRLVIGNLEEIGERSALLLVDAPIRRSSKVSINCDTCSLRGVVQSCRFEQPLGYMIEVMLDSDSCWSPRWFTPKHLMFLFGHAA